MSSSKEVFALRKEGSLDEAYTMALEIIEADPNDEWNIKAIAWCLYDLTISARRATPWRSPACARRPGSGVMSTPGVTARSSR